MPSWNQVLEEITDKSEKGRQIETMAVDEVRRSYLYKLHEHTGRNVIAYYSGWLSKQSPAPDITDEDKNGFMSAIHGLDRSLGLDLILHTPGGSISATQSIVDYLHQMFNGDIRAIVPQIAMSAGTMLACSCKSIVMGKESNLGPIDPHLMGLPVNGVVREFERAYEEISDDINKAHVWRPILEKYHPTFLLQCEDARDWSKEFVVEQLNNVMFKDSDPTPAQHIVDYLSSSDRAIHDRHIHIDECRSIGLVVESLEADEVLQDLVLTVHHCFMHTFMNTPAFKIVENHQGIALVKITR